MRVEGNLPLAESKLIVFSGLITGSPLFLLNRCIRLVSTGALLTLVKKVIRLTRHNQAVEFFFFGGVYWRYNCQGNLRMSRYNCQGNLGMLSISYCAIYFHFLDQIQGINILGRFSSPSLHKPFGFTFTIFIKTICLNQINFAVTESSQLVETGMRWANYWYNESRLIREKNFTSNHPTPPPPPPKKSIL